MTIKQKNIHEDREVSCRVLIDLIRKEEDPRKRKLYLHDFLSKSLDLRETAKLYYTLEVYREIVMPEYKDVIKQYQKKTLTPRTKIDIGIITIKNFELNAAKIALGIDFKKESDHKESGYKYWIKDINTVKGKKLKTVLTMVGKPRGINISNACRTMFNIYDIKMCILIGIAAGLESKVKIADIVVPETIYDIEGMRLEGSGAKKRPIPYNMKRSLARSIEYFDLKVIEWKEAFQNNMNKIRELYKTPDLPELFEPEIHNKIILTGEKLLADGSLELLREEHHDETRAYEMEGGGFAATCDECGIPWIVFRGISDYGDPTTKDGIGGNPHLRKIWQPIAALSAATIAILYMRNEIQQEDIVLF